MVEPIVPPTAAKDVRKPESTPRMVRTFHCLAVDLEVNRVLMQKDITDQIHSLDETRKPGLGSKQESTGEDSSRDRIWPANRTNISGAYTINDSDG